jgi:hypothetical protein
MFYKGRKTAENQPVPTDGLQHGQRHPALKRRPIFRRPSDGVRRTKFLSARSGSRESKEASLLVVRAPGEKMVCLLLVQVRPIVSLVFLGRNDHSLNCDPDEDSGGVPPNAWPPPAAPSRFSLPASATKSVRRRSPGRSRSTACLTLPRQTPILSPDRRANIPGSSGRHRR